MDRYHWLVDADMRGPSVVLPVVGVYAFGGFVFGEVEGAELCFIVEHVEIFIFGVVVDQFGEDLFLVVGVGAEVAVGTLVDRVGVVEAEVFLVFLLVVVLFD